MGVIALGGAVLTWIGHNFAEESYIRKKQKKFRSAKQQLLSIRDENLHRAREIRNLRGNLEYERRGALIAYYKHRRVYLESIAGDLHEAKQAMYDKVVAIRTELRQTGSRRKFIDSEIWKSYQDADTRIHTCIGNTKEVEQAIRSQMTICSEALSRLTDRSTHNRLGAKKAIKELLDSNERDIKARYQKRRNADLIFPFGSTHLFLEQRCSQCNTHVAPEMAFCFICGCEFEGRESIAVPDVECTGVPCSNCGADLDEGLIYCFNCGERNDPFGLIAAFNA